MNKTKLQAELKNKIKPGIKPSDLRKKPLALNKDKKSGGEVKLSIYGLLTPPDSPILKPNQSKLTETPPDSPLLKPTKPSKPANNIKDLQEQVIYWSQTAQNHLLNLSKTSAALFNAEDLNKSLNSLNKGLKERIKELEKATNSYKSPLKNPTKTLIKDQPETLNEAAEKALIEANQKIREQQDRIRELEEKLKQTITIDGQGLETSKQNSNKDYSTKNTEQTKITFLCSDCHQTKPTPELSRQFNNFSFCRSCSLQARKAAQKEKANQPQQFTCHSCQQTKPETPTKMKLGQTLQEYNVCASCKPNVKEFNEADLITDELWEKYPYSSASEILEKEFGIKRRSE